MSGNVILAGPNYADDATVTSAVSWVASLPLANVLDSTRSIARTTSTSGSITLEFGTALNIGVICLWRTTAGAGASLSVVVYSGASLSGTLLYSGSMARRTFQSEEDELVWHTAILPANVSARSLRVNFSGVSSPLDISRLFAGPIWIAPSGENFDYGDGVLPLSDAVTVRAADGSLRTLAGPAYREMSLSLSALSDDSRAALRTIFERGGDVFLSAYPDDAVLGAEHEMLCRLKSGRGRGSRAAGWWFEE